MMKYFRYFLPTLIAVFLLIGNAYADEAGLRRKIQQQLGSDAKIQSIKKTPYGGLYEVYMNDRLHYTDEQFSFMIVGTLIDTRKNMNYSELSMRQFTAKPLSWLPPKDLALHIQDGSGGANPANQGIARQTLYVFSDPLCSHCKTFETTLQAFPELDIYVYLMPNDAVNRGSGRMAKAIWCADRPVQTYLDFMRKGITPDERGRAGCELSVKPIYEAAQKFGFQGTPAVVFQDGYSSFGKIDEGKLRAILRQTPKTETKH